MTSEEERWFDPGSYGYGPGMPRSWQAWGLCAAYSLVNVAAAWLVVDRSLLGFLAIAAGATILFPRHLRAGRAPGGAGPNQPDSR